MICQNCANIVSDKDKYCNYCGSQLVSSGGPQDVRFDTQAIPAMPQPLPQKGKALIVMCAVLSILLGAGGFLAVRYKDEMTSKLLHKPPVETQGTEDMPEASHDGQSFGQKPENAEINGDDVLLESIVANDPAVADTPNEIEEIDFSEETVIEEAAQTLLAYYLSYLSAINRQDPSDINFVTPSHREQLTERIFGENKDYTFSLDEIILDLDTVNIYERNGRMNVSFCAAFTFGYKSRVGSGKVSHGANIQLVEMIFDESERSWLVDNGEILSGADIGANRLTLK